VSPFVGGSIGASYVSETLRREVTLGTAISAWSTTLVTDEGWGVGLFGKAGLMFMRGWAARLLLAAEVGTTLNGLHGRGYPLHLNVQLGVMF
jgi:hypothetical protein